MQPRGLETLESKIAEVQFQFVPLGSADSALYYLSVFDFLWLQHRTCLLLLGLRPSAFSRLFLAGKDLAAEDPGLDPDYAVRGLGFGETVRDIGPQGLQRNTSLAVPFSARYFSSAEAS